MKIFSGTQGVGFSGTTTMVEIGFENTEAEPVEFEARYRLWQTSSASAAPIGGVRAWKTITLGGKQRQLESLPLELPATRVAVTFRVEVFRDEQALGNQKVIGFPAGQFSAMRLAVLDPSDPFATALAELGAKVSQIGIGDSPSPGLIAVLGPFEPKRGAPPTLKQWIPELRKQGTAVVVLGSSGLHSATSLLVSGGVAQANLVLADPEQYRDLESNAGAQLRFLEQLKLAAGQHSIPFFDAK